MSFNTSKALEEIKARCNIVDVVERAVPLKRAGSNFKGCCPFHSEKTPSFVVSEQKQIFTCFGCGASGDVIEFTKRYYNLDFSEAIEKLAGEYGITLEKTINTRDNKQIEKLFEINKEAAIFFYKAFRNGKNPGADYMQKRGIGPEILKKFGIGYADGEWNTLYEHLKNKGYDEKSLLLLGLISEKNGKYYDKYRDRVIFPIFNISGKVIGFGGRALGNNDPKYLNSPESPIFLKKNNLYALNFTKSDISKQDKAVLVEGYMDVISLYQAGITNVSASLGTALTDNQAKLLKRYTKNIILSYDSDAAGTKAALRGIDILQKENLSVKVMQVTDGKDPDEFVKNNGKLAFMKLVDEALPFADFKINKIRDNVDINTTEGMIAFLTQVRDVLSTLSPVEQDIYSKKLSKEYNISEGALQLDLDRISRAEHKMTFEQSKSSREKATISILEKELLKLAIIDNTYYIQIKDFAFCFESQEGKAIFDAIQNQRNNEVQNAELDFRNIEESLDPSLSMVFWDIIENTKFNGKEEKVLAECIKKIETRGLEKREQEILMMLSIADENENIDKIKELLNELKNIQMSIQKKKIQ